MRLWHAGSVAAVVSLLSGLAVTGTAVAGSPNCEDWWTIDDTARTVFTDSTKSVKFWGHRSCGGTSPQYWSAPYRPDEPGDYSWESVKTLHGNDPGAIAYGFELRRQSQGWVAVGFAASHG
ncbi:hypothetical protein [Amycolatopsis sp. NPDC059657]|uniref:hypothetical protein n=1 Tax=Amycolatopsis sp. NPDC059657 TaxID=3346899 RepID=UPI00366E0A74